MTLPPSVIAARLYYDHLLETEFDRTRSLLEKGISERGLVFHERPICNTLRPFFITSEHYESLMRAATLVSKGLTALVSRLVQDSSFRRVLALGETEEALIATDPRVPIEIFGRIDGFLEADGTIRFIEYNPLGGGSLDGDELAAVFLEMPIMKRFSQRYSCGLLSTGPRLLEALLQAHVRRGRCERPSIGILKQVDSDDAPSNSILSASVLSLPETRKSFAMAQAAGCTVRYVEPRQLIFDERGLRDGEHEVDTLIGANWPRFFRELGPDAPLWRAVRAGAAWILNSPVIDILHANKKTFALLSDPEYEGFFGSEVRHALRRHIPWTRIVRDCKTTYREEPIDLLPFIAAHRESLVLKPADGFGGLGVVLGWLSDEASWRRAVEAAVRGSFVVQERVRAPRDVFPSVGGGALSFEEHFFDFNPFVWRGTEAAGCMIRISPTMLMNQSAGAGSNIPVLLLEGSTST